MPTPRLLLVEDDPTSRQILVEVLRGLPAIVDAAGNCADARQLARHQRYALWLLDVELPDGDGITLLHVLRREYADGRALAHTASDDPDLHARLHDSGFSHVIRKPVAARHLLATVRQALAAADPSLAMTTTTSAKAIIDAADAAADASTDTADAPDWDDAAACRALGSMAHVVALRDQFLATLTSERAAIDTACRANDETTLMSLLHRQRAACGFVGAARLEACVRALRDAVTAEARNVALARFHAACDALQTSTLRDPTPGTPPSDA